MNSPLISVQNTMKARCMTLLPLLVYGVLSDIRSAYHLYGKRDNSGENSKTVIPFEVLPFSRLYRNGRNFVPFVWLTSARLPLKAEGDLF